MKNKILSLSAAFLFLLVLASPAFSGQFMAGASSADITPDPEKMKVPSSGYYNRFHKPMEGVHDRVFCKALVVSDSNGKAALVTCDIIGISGELRKKVLREINSIGINDENLMMTASHTHSGPGAMQKNLISSLLFGKYNEKHTRRTADLIVDAIIEADSSMAPASMKVGIKILDDVTRDRRDPAKSYNYDSRRFSNNYDPQNPTHRTNQEVTSIFFENENQGTIAVVFNFASHGTVLGFENMLISADWPGVAQRNIEKEIPGAVALFVNGAIADQAPTMIKDDGNDDFAYLEIIGGKVSDGVLSSRSEAVSVEEVPVRSVMVWREIPPGNRIMSIPVPKALVKHYFSPMPIQAIRIGDVVIMGTPLEMVSEIGFAMRDGAKGQGVPYPVVAGLANEIFLYCVTPEDFPDGGYEVGNTVFGKIEAGIIIGEEMLLVRKLLRD
jgi:neutral/alkaline ceramidase-like enzyme